PAIADPLVESDRAVGRLGREIWSNVIDAKAHSDLLPKAARKEARASRKRAIRPRKAHERRRLLAVFAGDLFAIIALDRLAMIMPHSSGTSWCMPATRANAGQRSKKLKQRNVNSEIVCCEGHRFLRLLAIP